MALYSPPPKNNIPFSFTTGGYQPPDFGDVHFSFSELKSSDLQAAINVLKANYQEETYTFLKYCEQYIIGYSQYGVQILKGRCHYGGVRDIGASIVPFLYYDRSLSASLSGLTYENLPSTIDLIPPEDLPAYLKVWPQKNLHSRIRGWQTYDLGGILNTIAKENLPATAGGHLPGDINARIKGWVREAYKDLLAYIMGYAVSDLPTFIRGTLEEDLGAFLFPVQPKNLSAFIHGWQEANLSANIIGGDWPWNLPASITGTGNFYDLTAHLKPITSLGTYKNLPAYILTTKGVQNLPAYLAASYFKNLTAVIDTGHDIKDLTAEIYPKVIRLTGIINIITMEHKDLSATISIPCFYSDFRDLMTYIRPVFQSNLGAFIYPRDWAKGILNLGAKWGYADSYVVQDKLPINLTLAAAGYRVEDKYSIYLKIYRGALNLAASIYGEYVSVDMPASIFSVPLYPYEFDNHKFRELFYNRTYSQVVQNFQEIDIEFEDIVKDYIYSSAGNVVAKTTKYGRFLTKISSYYSPATAARLGRTLHKTKRLYALDKFSSIDEAMRYAIYYVTTDFSADLKSTINAVGMYTNLSAYLNGITYSSGSFDLNSNITATISHPYSIVVSFDNDGVGYLNF